MKNLIITAHHKFDNAIPIYKKYFYPIHVGAILSNDDLGIERDDSGDHISFKNKSYCELTALYYVWKNKDYEYAGLMHYRRIFTIKSNILEDMGNVFKYYLVKFFYFISIKNLNLYQNNAIRIYTQKDLINHSIELHQFFNSSEFENLDIILPRKVKYAYLNLKDQYAINHCKHQFELFNEIIIKFYPEFREIINSVNSSKEFYPYNMFVMKRKFYDEYHEKLFIIVDELEVSINLKFMSSYQRRIFGFLSERFLNYYIEFKKRNNKNLRIRELQTIFVMDNIK